MKLQQQPPPSPPQQPPPPHQQQLKLERQTPTAWAFNRPAAWEFFDRKLDRAEDLRRAGNSSEARSQCLEIVEACPCYLPAHNLLGLIARDSGELDEAIAAFEAGYISGYSCVPAEFEIGRDRISWDYEDNRAYLLACEYLGVCYLEKAELCFEHVVEHESRRSGHRGDPRPIATDFAPVIILNGYLSKRRKAPISNRGDISRRLRFGNLILFVFFLSERYNFA